MFAIQILEQWNGIFASDSGQVFEARHIQPGRLRFFQSHSFAQIEQRVAMKHQIVGNFHQNFVAQEQRNDFLRSQLIYFQSCEHIFQRRNDKTGIGKCSFDNLFRLRFFIFHDYAAPGQTDQFTRQFNLPGAHYLVEHVVKDLGRDRRKTSTQFFLAHADNQWVAFVECLECGSEIFANEFERRPRNENVTDADNFWISRGCRNNHLRPPAGACDGFGNGQTPRAACGYPSVQPACPRSLAKHL